MVANATDLVNMKKSLKDLEIFKNIKDEEIRPLLFCLNYKIRTVQKYEMIVLEGSKTDNIYILLDGIANVVKESSEGEPHLIDILSPGDIFEVDSAYNSNKTYLYSLEASTKCIVAILNKHRTITPCVNMCDRHIKFIKNLIEQISNNANRKNKHIYELSQRNTRLKILRFLQKKQKIEGNDYFDIPFNRNEMANYLSVDRSALSKELSNLKKEGILDYDKNHFHLKNTNKKI